MEKRGSVKPPTPPKPVKPTNGHQRLPDLKEQNNIEGKHVDTSNRTPSPVSLKKPVPKKRSLVPKHQEGMFNASGTNISPNEKDNSCEKDNKENYSVHSSQNSFSVKTPLNPFRSSCVQEEDLVFSSNEMLQVRDQNGEACIALIPQKARPKPKPRVSVGKASSPHTERASMDVLDHQGGTLTRHRSYEEALDTDLVPQSASEMTNRESLAKNQPQLPQMSPGSPKRSAISGSTNLNTSYSDAISVGDLCPSKSDIKMAPHYKKDQCEIPVPKSSVSSQKVILVGPEAPKPMPRAPKDGDSNTKPSASPKPARPPPPLPHHQVPKDMRTSAPLLVGVSVKPLRPAPIPPRSHADAAPSCASVPSVSRERAKTTRESRQNDGKSERRKSSGSGASRNSQVYSASVDAPSQKVAQGSCAVVSQDVTGVAIHCSIPPTGESMTGSESKQDNKDSAILSNDEQSTKVKRSSSNLSNFFGKKKKKSKDKDKKKEGRKSGNASVFYLDCDPSDSAGLQERKESNTDINVHEEGGGAHVQEKKRRHSRSKSGEKIMPIAGDISASESCAEPGLLSPTAPPRSKKKSRIISSQISRDIGSSQSPHVLAQSPPSLPVAPPGLVRIPKTSNRTPETCAQSPQHMSPLSHAIAHKPNSTAHSPQSTIVGYPEKMPEYLYVMDDTGNVIQNASSQGSQLYYSLAKDCGCGDQHTSGEGLVPVVPPRNCQAPKSAPSTKKLRPDFSQDVHVTSKHSSTDNEHEYIIPGADFSEEEPRSSPPQLPPKVLQGSTVTPVDLPRKPARLPAPPFLTRRSKSSNGSDCSVDDDNYSVVRDMSGRCDGTLTAQTTLTSFDQPNPDYDDRATLTPNTPAPDYGSGEEDGNEYLDMSAKKKPHSKPPPEHPPPQRPKSVGNELYHEQNENVCEQENISAMRNSSSHNLNSSHESSICSSITSFPELGLLPGSTEPYAITWIGENFPVTPSSSNFELSGSWTPKEPSRPKSWHGRDDNEHNYSSVSVMDESLYVNEELMNLELGGFQRRTISSDHSSSDTDGSEAGDKPEETKLKKQALTEEELQHKEQRRKAKAFCAAKEIMTTEATFVRVLKLLNEEFRQYTRKCEDSTGKPVVPEMVLDQIFKIVPMLQNFNEQLLKDLSQRIRHWDTNPKIADIFVEKGPFLKMYTSYIRDFETMTSSLENARKKYPDFDQTTKTFEAGPVCRGLALTHCMLKPIQRIPQYRLMLQAYKKYLMDGSAEYKNTQMALVVVSEVADHANQSMKFGDNLKRLMEIQSNLVGQFEVVKPGRYIVMEGILQKLSRKEMQPRMFFLFNDFLLYTTPTSSGWFRLNKAIPITGMKVELPKKEDFQNEFSIISTQRSFTISASSPEERDSWIKSLQNTINENKEKRYSYLVKQHDLPELMAMTTYDGDREGQLGSRAPVWIPDVRVTMCMICQDEFTMTFRRHHCRACGKVICSVCSDYRAPLKYLSYKPSRVCKLCFNTLETEMTTKLATYAFTPGGEGGIISEHFSSQCSRNDSTLLTGLSTRFVHGTQTVQAKIWRSFGKGPKVGRPLVLQEVSANDEDSDMSGYLKMWDNRKWKKVWFVIKRKVLYYYKASEDMAAYKSIPLIGFEVRPYHSNMWFQGVEPILIFEVMHKGLPSLIFRTESPSSRDRWITAIRKATLP